MGLPAIRGGSPLAEGLTVNACMRGDKWNLRVWAQGAPVEDSIHDTPTDLVNRLVTIVIERMGGAHNLAAAVLKML